MEKECSLRFVKTTRCSRGARDQALFVEVSKASLEPAPGTILSGNKESQTTLPFLRRKGLRLPESWPLPKKRRPGPVRPPRACLGSAPRRDLRRPPAPGSCLARPGPVPYWPQRLRPEAPLHQLFEVQPVGEPPTRLRRSWSFSTRTARSPMCARQAVITSPTYPAPVRPCLLQHLLGCLLAPPKTKISRASSCCGG
jgi:hypothetical protein